MYDTIAAQSTAYGPAAIGILRLTGPEAIDIAARCFRPYNGKPLTESYLPGYYLQKSALYTKKEPEEMEEHTDEV